jgi:hypothetical protein
VNSQTRPSAFLKLAVAGVRIIEDEAADELDDDKDDDIEEADELEENDGARGEIR